MARRRLGACLAAVFACATGFAAAAQAGDDAFFGDIAGVNVGGFVVVAPKYEGSSDYRAIGVPFVAPAFDGGGRLQFKGPDDVRFRLFELNGFEAGPLAGWRFGRDEEDSRRLRGLGDVDGGLVAGGYMAYRAGFLKPFLSYHHQITGDDAGGVVRFGSEAIWQLGRGSEIVGSVGASWADQRYMDAYFSVTPGQSAASLAGLPIYDADAGIKDVFVGATAKVALSELWTLNLTGRYAHLVGDAADSPVTESVHQWTAGVGLTYRLNLR